MVDQTSTLPSQISYNTLTLPINASKDGGEGKIYLGRREVFDIRTQLMAEDDDGDDDDEQNGTNSNDTTTPAPGAQRIRNKTLISGLEKGDLTPGVYEGGFKTWECAVYLASYLPKEEEEEGAGCLTKTAGNQAKGDEEEEWIDQVIELGCGSAMPSLALFARLLRDKRTRKTRRRTRFVLADYNDVVLRMVTIPNFILTWWLNAQPHQDNSNDNNDDSGEGSDGLALEGELDIDASLLEAFAADLAELGITIDLISGAWSASFVDLVSRGGPDHSQAGSGRTLVLASETVYSPDSLVAFSDTLLAFLRWPRSRALVAAKKVYFGVGGGVDEFLHVLHQRKTPNEDVDAKSMTETSADGVGRTILQVLVKSKSNTPGTALANS